MIKTQKIRPVAGRIVKDPRTGQAITTDTIVPLNSFWVRRLRDGDVQAISDTPAVKKQTLETKG